MSYTLLLADDSVTIQRVIELTFADEDVQVVAVSDGDQAVERLESSPPDIVLADVGMPGRNGYEVARYVKQSPKLSHIPVVLLTGAFEPVDQARAAEVGCDGVLAKPFEPQLVISRVKELLTGPAKQPAPPASVASEPPAMPLAAPPPPPVAPPAPAPADLDDYFERLDVAFSNLSGGADQAQRLTTAGQTGNEIDRFRSEHPSHPTPDLQPVPVSPPTDEDLQQWTATERAEQPAPPQPQPRPELPSIADAFAAILAAEQQAGTPVVRPVWPTRSGSGSNGFDAHISDELVDRVVRQVLDRMTDRVLRERVSEIVTSVAERLVRQEIERIKSSIK